MSEQVRIILPLPKRVLSPNCPVFSRQGRMAKAAATKKYRKMAKEATEDAQVNTGPWSLASVAVVFFHKVKRRRDQDNAMGSLKAAYDGIVDAGLIVDDDWEHLQRELPTFEIDKKNPRVELIVTRIK